MIEDNSMNTVDAALEIENFHVWIGDNHVLDNINLAIPKNKITCIIGPSGSGKSTLLRSINRINDDISGLITKGKINFHEENIYSKEMDTAQLRSNIGMVFQKPCIFPKSIAENVLFGVKNKRKLSKIEKNQLVESGLKSASLWKEVAHRLREKASALSIGQQQRLCIARSLIIKPEIILMDEPTSALDPISSRSIEEMLSALKKEFTVLFVTHNIQQAKRIADHLVFICDGKLIESGNAKDLFNQAKNSQTKAYLNDEYCEC